MKVAMTTISDKKTKVVEFEDALDVRNDCEPHERIKPKDFREQLERGETVSHDWFEFRRAAE